MNIMFSTLQQLGDKVGEENVDSEYASANFSQLTFKESHDRLARSFSSIARSRHWHFTMPLLGRQLRPE